MLGKDKNFITNGIDNYLDRLVDENAKRYVNEFARKPDGTFDEKLAARIDVEVHRRGAIGRQLDIYEPLRWTGISFVLTILSTAATAKFWKKDINAFAKGALASLAVSTAVNSVVQLIRLVPRYLSGLRGGVETAVSMQDFNVMKPSHEINYPEPLSSFTQSIEKKSPVSSTTLMEQAGRANETRGF